MSQSEARREKGGVLSPAEMDQLEKTVLSNYRRQLGSFKPFKTLFNAADFKELQQQNNIPVPNVNPYVYDDPYAYANANDDDEEEEEEEEAEGNGYYASGAPVILKQRPINAFENQEMNKKQMYWRDDKNLYYDLPKRATRF